MYKEIIINVNEDSPYKRKICYEINQFIGIHRVDQLSGIVYKGFVHETAIEELMDEIDWTNRNSFREWGFKLYIIGERTIEEVFECNRILRNKKWNGHSFVTTMGPV